MATELNAAFFAFKKRERGGVLLTTSIAYLLVTALLSAALIAALWTQITPLIGWYMQLMQGVAAGDTTNVTTPPLAGMVWLGLGYAIWFIAWGLLTAAYEAACLKWMIHGEREGFLGLSVGADTWRVYVTYWVWFAGLIAFYLAIVLVIVAIAAVSAAGAPGWVTTILGLLTPVAIIAGLLFFSVRFAPAAATSVARRRFAFFDAWKVTKDRYWELLGAFVIVIAIYIGASMAIGMVTSTVLYGSIMSNIDWQSMATDEAAFLRSYFEAIMGMFTNPVTLSLYLVTVVINFALSILIYVMFYGVNARAAQAALEEGKIAAA